jgi:predicted transcriptional regulator
VPYATAQPGDLCHQCGQPASVIVGTQPTCTDHFTTFINGINHHLAELDAAQAAQDWDGLDDTPETDLEHDLAESWRAIDLTDALAGLRESPPTILARIDDAHLLYRGRMHWIMGEPESLKSWLAQLAVAQTLQAGEHVLYIDFEDTEHAVIERLVSMGINKTDIAEHLVYLRPKVPLGDRSRITKADMAFVDTLSQRTFALAILDGVTESLAIERLDPNDNAEIADWLGRLPRRLALTGAATVVIDHVTKAPDTRGRFAIGAQHKLAGLDGVAYGMQIIRPLARADTEPVTGTSRIVVSKDRPGWVRAKCIDEKIIGTLEVTSYPDGGTTAAITIDLTTAEPPLAIVSEVMKVLGTFGGEDTEAHLVKHCDYNESEVIEAVRWLLDAEWIEPDKRGNSTVYRLTDKGKKEE